MASKSSLSTSINEATTTSAFPRNAKLRFCPRWVLKSITEGSIREHFSMDPGTGALTFPSCQEHKVLIDYILHYVRELFAVFVFMALPNEVILDCVRSCRQNGITDSMIPKSDGIVDKIFPENLLFVKDSFQRYRYMFQAPILSGVQKYERRALEDDVPIPIVALDRDLTSIGNFSFVYKVTIHELYLDKSDPLHQVRYWSPT